MGIFWRVGSKRRTRFSPRPAPPQHGRVVHQGSRLESLGRGMALSPHDVAIRTMDDGAAVVELFGDAALCHHELGAGNIQVEWALEADDQVIVTARLAA